MLLNQALNANTKISTVSTVDCTLDAPYVKVWLTQNDSTIDFYSQNTHIELNISVEEFFLYNFQ
jgi:hypothetical protein